MREPTVPGRTSTVLFRDTALDGHSTAFHPARDVGRAVLEPATQESGSGALPAGRDWWARTVDETSVGARSAAACACLAGPSGRLQISTGHRQWRKYLSTITTNPKQVPMIVSIISAVPRAPA